MTELIEKVHIAGRYQGLVFQNTIYSLSDQLGNFSVVEVLRPS